MWCARPLREARTGDSQGTGGKTLWLQEVVHERGLQIKSISSKANKADLGTTVLLVARLNALRAACGIVVPGGMLSESAEDENDDG